MTLNILNPETGWKYVLSKKLGLLKRVNSKTRTLLTYLPMKMEQIKCSETSAYIIQTPGNYPKENIIKSEQHL
jgi:hypothetical protein